MHELMNYVCDELETLERKVEKDGKLSMAEIEYADKLLHMKKNLLKVDKMTGEGEFSMAYEPYHDRSYARGRDHSIRANQYGSYNMGYSRKNKEMIEELRDMMEDAPDERTRSEFEKLIHKMEQV